MNKPCVYILLCSNGKYYTGSTIDIDRRLFQHINGTGAEYTKQNAPVELVYIEFFDRIEDGFQREKQIQKWSHAKKRALIEQNWERLTELSVCKNITHFSNNINR